MALAGRIISQSLMLHLRQCLPLSPMSFYRFSSPDLHCGNTPGPPSTRPWSGPRWHNHQTWEIFPSSQNCMNFFHQPRSAVFQVPEFFFIETSIAKVGREAFPNFPALLIIFWGATVKVPSWLIIPYITIRKSITGHLKHVVLFRPRINPFWGALLFWVHIIASCKCLGMVSTRAMTVLIWSIISARMDHPFQHRMPRYPCQLRQKDFLLRERQNRCRP